MFFDLVCFFRNFVDLFKHIFMWLISFSVIIGAPKYNTSGGVFKCSSGSECTLLETHNNDIKTAGKV